MLKKSTSLTSSFVGMPSSYSARRSLRMMVPGTLLFGPKLVRAETKEKVVRELPYVLSLGLDE